MGKNIFISVLGTNNYIPCNYYYPDSPEAEKVEAVRFVQEAVLRLEASKGNSIDKAIVYLTEEAEKKNWHNNGHMDRDGNSIEVEGLASRLEKAGILSQPVKIKSGRSEDEIWEIFNTIVETVDEGCNLWIDITHSFRSLPLIMLAVINYLKMLKGVNVKQICYGAMEVLGDFRTVEAMDITERDVPIFDLTHFNTILEWSHAINDFRMSGNASMIHSLSYSGVLPLLKASRGQNKGAVFIRMFAERLDRLCNVLGCNRGPELANASDQLLASLSATGDGTIEGILPPLVPFFNIIRSDFQSFRGDTLDRGIAAAKWCLEHNFVPQGYTILQESIITWCLEKLNEETEMVSKREAVSSAFVIRQKGIEYDDWNSNAKEYQDIIENLHSMEWFSELALPMDILSQQRNNINHAGYDANNRQRAEKLKTHLEDSITEITNVKQAYDTACKDCDT